MTDQCSRDFFKFFSENMDALGAPVPTSLFGTVDKALSTINGLLGLAKVLGKTTACMTVAELVSVSGALVTGELVAIAGAMSASLYLGAVIGSFIIATQRTVSCGKTIAEYIGDIDRHPRLDVPAWLRAQLMHDNEVFLWRNRARQTTYAHKLMRTR